ncbi:MAG: UDP-N-acetyl-alpha-D-muramoyl-L-alanyl-L-glutamate epimerase [Lysobacteraceae bacterium]
MSSFDPTSISRFRFVRRDFDADSGCVELAYAFDDGEEMLETLVIPGAPFALDAERRSAVDAALRLLHLIAGVSYFKAAVPPEIVVDDGALDAESAALLTSIYENGLGEFAYNNGLALRGKIRFPVDDAAEAASATALGLEQRALVAIGGGKDSLVSIETLREAGVAQTVAWIGGSQLIAACAGKTGFPTLNIERRLSPRLFELNRDGALNGHIPVTAINSAILVLVALLTGHDQVVFSNERSASYGSLIPGTGEVNHQWSKGWDFERAFGDYVERRVAADLRYYSLLRPFSELAVTQRFARIGNYDDVFSSCNRNFHILGEKPSSRWCGHCPKCRFVFLALAPFMPKPRLLAIFGRNLLDEAAQIAGFDALLEFRDHKPFECVGEGVESRAALNALTNRAEWREDALVRRFADEVLPHLDAGELDLAEQLQPRGEHRVPAPLMERLGEDFGA